MPRLFPPVPDRDDVLTVKPPRNRFEPRIRQWLQAVVDGFNGRAEVLGFVQERNVTEALGIGPTGQPHRTAGPITTVPTSAPLPGGVYRVSISTVITATSIPIIFPAYDLLDPPFGFTLASTVNSYFIGIFWTLNGIARDQYEEVPMRSGDAPGYQTLIRIDAGTVIQYRILYKLNVGGRFSHTITRDLDVVIEAVR